MTPRALKDVILTRSQHQYYPLPSKASPHPQTPYINQLASASLVIYAMNITWVLMRLNFFSPWQQV